MAELTASIVAEVVSACQAGAAEAAEAFGRALDARLSLAVGEPGTIDPANLPEELSGPGLAIVLVTGGVGAMVLLPEGSGLVPAWCANPDPTGQSKLTTLAQELGMLVLPEALMPEDFKTAYVKSLAGALGRGGVAEGAAVVGLSLSAEGKQGIARLIWPVPKPAAVVGAAKEKAPESPAPKPPTAAVQAVAKGGSGAEPAPQAGPKQGSAPKRPATGRRELPGYTRSLLRVKVPVVVTLAEKRQPLGRIIELGPGAIIQFEKSCEEMLALEAGGHPIALGEAVKVGDKFGLRVNSMILPGERFLPVKPGAP